MYFTKEGSKYIESEIKNGTSLEQAIAQMEVLRDERLFQQNLVDGLSNPDVLKKLKEIIGEIIRREPYD